MHKNNKILMEILFIKKEDSCNTLLAVVSAK
jgi:hypothetical protein